MNYFENPLVVELIDDLANNGRGEWKLIEPLRYVSETLSRECTLGHKFTLVIPAHFTTDFASVDRVPGVFLLFGDTAHRAAVVHDYLYITHIVSRKIADEVFLEACKASGISAWRSNLMYAAVRLGGSSFYDD